MSTNHSPRATATLLRKLKGLASQLQRDDQSIARHLALERAAQACGFKDYDSAARGHRGRAGDTAAADEPLSVLGRMLVSGLERMADKAAAGDEHAYLLQRLETIRVWRQMADSGRQAALYRVQMLISSAGFLAVSVPGVRGTGLLIADEDGKGMQILVSGTEEADSRMGRRSRYLEGERSPRSRARAILRGIEGAKVDVGVFDADAAGNDD